MKTRRNTWRRWDAYNAKVAKGDKDAVAPKSDLKLEALADVLRGKLYVQIHCYRADEFLTEEAIAHEYGYKIRAFHHALEMYKVADKIAPDRYRDRHLCRLVGVQGRSLGRDSVERGDVACARAVRVALKSDSNDHIRRLNQEAGKMVHYGGATEDEAHPHGHAEPGMDYRRGRSHRLDRRGQGRGPGAVESWIRSRRTRARRRSISTATCSLTASLPGFGTPHFSGAMHDAGFETAEDEGDGQ